VVSGHGVVYAAVPLALSTYYPLPAARGGPSLAAWLAVAKLCIQETVDKTHYSVDMLLAVVLTALVWRWREPLYPPAATWAPRPSGTPPDPLPARLVALVLATLAVVFVGVAGT
jgi:MFS superfamily sulfate permease-like transporter